MVSALTNFSPTIPYLLRPPSPLTSFSPPPVILPSLTFLPLPHLLFLANFVFTSPSSPPTLFLPSQFFSLAPSRSLHHSHLPSPLPHSPIIILPPSSPLLLTSLISTLNPSNFFLPLSLKVLYCNSPAASISLQYFLEVLATTQSIKITQLSTLRLSQYLLFLI